MQCKQVRVKAWRQLHGISNNNVSVFLRFFYNYIGMKEVSNTISQIQNSLVNGFKQFHH